MSTLREEIDALAGAEELLLDLQRSPPTYWDQRRYFRDRAAAVLRHYPNEDRRREISRALEEAECVRAAAAAFRRVVQPKLNKQGGSSQ